jgi:putative AdoMet-dependent methyltransferase
MKVREMDIEFYRLYANALEAQKGPPWRYNEMKHRGVNYNSLLRARAYDKEGEEIFRLLGLDTSSTVIDIGCGTGAFSIYAARRLAKVYAVDVSKAMLRCARRKARKAKLNNIEFHHGGFLTYEHEAETVDAVVSVAALHHLPDFWKLIGLRRLMLKTGGKLCLFDMVFSFDVARYESCIKGFIQSMSERMGPDEKQESEIHLREEYSTCDWIMEGLLERAGFMIKKDDYTDGFLAMYLCTRKVI